MSNKKPKGKLDAITFIYGFGAAVVFTVTGTPTLFQLSTPFKVCEAK
jgi:hypothetical protein